MTDSVEHRPVWFTRGEIDLRDDQLAYLARVRFHGAPENATLAIRDALHAWSLVGEDPALGSQEEYVLLALGRRELEPPG